MTLSNISTGEQHITAVGAVTGSLDTSALTGDYTVKVRIRGLASGKSAIVAIEDTANSSAFSEAVQVAVKHFTGGDEVAQGTTAEWRQYDIPRTRFGVTNSKLRANVLSTNSTDFYAYAWLEA